LDISSNKIESFPKNIDFSPLYKLKLFYLHNNLFNNPPQIQVLNDLPQLMYVTLFNNPLQCVPNIRHFLVNLLKGLKALDFNCITDEERLSNISTLEKFSGLSEITKLSWPIVTYNNSQEL
jgi:hypothetical protein